MQTPRSYRISAFARYAWADMGRHPRTLSSVFSLSLAATAVSVTCCRADPALANPPVATPSTKEPAREAWPTEGECRAARADRDGPENSQLDINVKFGAKATVATCEMRQAYDALKQSVTTDPAAVAKLQRAQDRWREYRDAHGLERFPHKDDDDAQVVYGSVFPMCFAIEMEGTTSDRTKELRSARKCAESAATATAAKEAARSADVALNDAYRKVVSAYANDRTFLAAFRRAEMAWLKFRDAHVDFVATWSHDPDSACAERALERVVRARTEEIKRWLAAPVEGDVCGG